MSAASEEAELLHGRISILSNAGTRIKIIATALADARREGWEEGREEGLDEALGVDRPDTTAPIHPGAKLPAERS